MLRLTLPGKPELKIENLVLDYNGTLAVDGIPIPGIIEKIVALSRSLKIYILTSDTHGTVRLHLKNVPASIHILHSADHSLEKETFIKEIGHAVTIAVGNGSNDALMLKNARIGIAVLQTEGAAVKTLINSDLVFTSIFDALDALSHPKRLLASLRE
ncbi:MAG: hypothetical protein J7L66_06330 [Anaerolineaceae bacterium]|nr:hypothetical protein [Anaerolineaceae bacterium]